MASSLHKSARQLIRLAPVLTVLLAIPAHAAPVLWASVDATMDAYAMEAPAPDPLPDPGPNPDPSPDPAGSDVSSPSRVGTETAHAAAPKRFALFAQSTLTAMNVFGFRDPYAGDNSLPQNDLRETIDATLYLGVRPWSGGEIWVNPEVDQGFGVGNTLGLAGYASGEAYKLGKASPYTRLQRAYVRQTFNLGGGREDVAAGPNQMAGSVTDNRLVVTVGKFCIVDIFDTNRYAHDPRGDFLNWSIIDSGGFDYAGDPWGFSYGGAAELYAGPWTLRAGLFNLSQTPGGGTLVKDFSENQITFELEHRHGLGGHPGAVRFGLWRNHGRLGNYREAIDWGIANSQIPDTNAVLRNQNRLGGYVNAEQELTGTLGAFLRASTADGTTGAFDFTDIDTSVSAGLSLAGTGWHRASDTVGVAVVANTISDAAKAYFAAGGKGILIGDGQLPHPGAEKIVESYYAWHPSTPLTVTLDYQLVFNPAYNRDRGPVNILGVRLHAAI